MITTGTGKSGIISRKIAATLSSTGTPSLFLHPAEAVHGDLGVLVESGALFILSNSGGTRELLRLAKTIERLNVPIIAMLGKREFVSGKNMLTSF